MASQPNFFHCYATANDDPNYVKDITNLIWINKYDPGVPNIQLFIAISEVNPVSEKDHEFVAKVKLLFEKNTKITLKGIFFKDNVGRDFSSFDVLLNKVLTSANTNDFVFFQNRSGFGPFKDDWLSSFKNQYLKFDNTAICGSTINFNDHPQRSYNTNVPHVQTYAFLIRVDRLQLLADGFPGKYETTNFTIVCKGEIELSQFYLNKNFTITCIEWPSAAINNSTKPLADSDIKRKVKQKHAFYHRLYYKRYIPLLLKHKINSYTFWSN